MPPMHQQCLLIFAYRGPRCVARVPVGRRSSIAAHLLWVGLYANQAPSRRQLPGNAGSAIPARGRG